MTAGPVTEPSEQARDAGPAEELFRSAYPVLAGWVRRLVEDDDTAREITSEAFARLLSRWDRVEHPRSYLFTIAANLVRDHWSTGERERRAIRGVTAGLAADPVTCPAQDVDVRSLIAALPPRQREPFLLHYYGGFPIREIAILLGRPAGTIKADLFAARARLKAALGIPPPERRAAPHQARLRKEGRQVPDLRQASRR
jgi:RNA polymerase sigma-70 factor (ECF subfamily)